MHAIPLKRSLGLGLLAFLILFNYEIVRPAVEATFTTDHGYQALRWAWLVVAVTMLVAVSLFNKVAARVPLLRLLALGAVGSAVLLAVILPARDHGVPGATYALYVWKDVHIVFLVEAFWMFANAVYRTESASWIYGLFCAAGSVGGASGARFSRWLISMGLDTTGVLWATTGVFALIALTALMLHRATPVQAKDADAPEARNWRAGFAVLKEQRILMLMLVLVGVTQLIINLVDYQFNGMVEAAYDTREARNVAMSHVYEWISYGALAMQVLTGPLLKLVGLPATMLALPMLVGGAAAAMLFAPRFITGAVAKVTTKVVDYSLFRATKELLYIPLTYREKTQGKAVIDILGYRMAKAGAAFILMGLSAVSAGLFGVGVITLALVIVWVVAAVWVLREYRATAQGRV